MLTIDSSLNFPCEMHVGLKSTEQQHGQAIPLLSAGPSGGQEMCANPSAVRGSE